MSAQKVTEHVYRVVSGDVSIYLLEYEGGLALIDAGFPDTPPALLEALRSLGRGPEDITDILLTHCHPDHAGGLAEIQKASGAAVWVHAADAPLVEQGDAFRPYQVTPGGDNQAFVDEQISRAPTTYEACPVDHWVEAGDIIPVAGGVEAVGTPGHTAGHVVFLWPGDGGVVFLGDSAKNVEGLGLSPIYEDLAQGEESLRFLGRRDFEVACFAHGPCIVGDASEIFRQRWA